MKNFKQVSLDIQGSSKSAAMALGGGVQWFRDNKPKYWKAIRREGVTHHFKKLSGVIYW